MIFISYAEADNAPLSGSNSGVGRIHEFLIELFKGKKIHQCEMSATSSNEHIYFYRDDVRTNSISLKIEKEIRSRPLMISFLSDNYFLSPLCRKESNLFYHYYGGDPNYFSRHLFVDLDNVLSMDVDDVRIEDLENNYASNISRCLPWVEDESDRSSIELLYRRIKRAKPRVYSLFQGSGVSPTQLNVNISQDHHQIIAKQVADMRQAMIVSINPFLKEYIKVFRQRKQRDHAEHIHLSAQPNDLQEAFQAAKIIWPSAFVTSMKAALNDFQYESEQDYYLSLCDKHVTYTTDPRDTQFVLQKLDDFRKARNDGVNLSHRNVILAANDIELSLPEKLKSDSRFAPGTRIEYLEEKSSDGLAKFLQAEVQK